MTVLSTVIARGVAAERPASAPTGTLFFSTDTAILEQWDGSAWVTYGTAGEAGPAGPAGADGAAGPAGATGPAGPPGSISGLTIKGELVTHDGTDPVFLPVGANGEVLKANSAVAAGIEWDTDAGGMIDPTTTLGDLIVNDATGVDRLGVGVDGEVLTAESTAPLGVTWAAPAGGGGGGGGYRPEVPRDWESGLWYGPFETFSSSLVLTWNTHANVIDVVHYLPVFVPNAVTVDRIGLPLGIASAGTMTLGLYANDPVTFLPAARIVDAGTIDSTTLGDKEVTISEALTAETWYWIAVLKNSGGASVRVASADWRLPLPGQATAGAIPTDNKLPRYSESSATLPATAAPTLSVAATVLARLRAA